MGEEKVEHFLVLVLKKFLSSHLAACDLNIVDDIIIEYLVAVIEDVGTTFDFEDFLEMMTAYIPGFDGIHRSFVTDWLFDIAAKMRNGAWVEEVAVLEVWMKDFERNGNMNVAKATLGREVDEPRKEYNNNSSQS